MSKDQYVTEYEPDLVHITLFEEEGFNAGWITREKDSPMLRFNA